MVTSAVDEQTSIRQAALDYAEGWYTADAGRMGRCLHPDLAKRAILRDGKTGAETFVHLTRDVMVAKTAQGGGRNSAATAECRVTILDVFGEVACVRVDSPEYVDYLHLAKSQGRWQIVNVLWADRA
jgi:hypothetical protein